jgi:galactokinase
VLRENERVLRGRDALRRGDLDELGAAMLGSHASSRDLFGNSCAELDFIVDHATGIEGFVGGKLSGGGFGGSTVCLVEATAATHFVAELSAAFRAEYGRDPRCFVTRAGDGSRALDDSA